MTRSGWAHAVGDIPFKVTVFENADRKDVLYLQWREARAPGGETNWRYRSLRKRLRSADGKIIKARQREAIAAAEAMHHTLIRGLPAEERPKPLLTLGQTRDLVTHPHTGLYPRDTPHRREALRALAFAVAVWGDKTPWAAIRKRQIRELWRRRLEQVRAKGAAGRRSAEIAVTRVGTIANWLRDDELIPGDACVLGRKWKEEIAAETPDAKVFRPRHTMEESRRLLAVAWDVDPRFGLLVSLGAELRLGQVCRARRGDLDLAADRFTSPGQGKKRGEVVYLTAGQRAAVDRALNGYLRELEATAEPDYRLFPAGQLAGGRLGEGVATKARHGDASPVNTRTIQAWFKTAERLAGIEHVKGRGYYGVRRASVDGAKAAGISREGLQKLGGWTDSQMPDQIYADQEASYAREEARKNRAIIRGEGT